MYRFRLVTQSVLGLEMRWEKELSVKKSLSRGKY